jgi:hypothetical protein
MDVLQWGSVYCRTATSLYQKTRTYRKSVLGHSV